MMLLTESGWRASVLTWLSPCGQLVRKKLKAETVAKKGFLWQVPEQHSHCYNAWPAEADSSGLDKVLCLLEHLFPDQSQANIMTMAGNSMGEQSCGYDEVMDLEDCADLVDRKCQSCTV
eukprot:1066959-Amphidinium_carterae.1